MPLTIGQKLKFFRKRLGISQLDLEVSADLSEGSISRIENDLIVPLSDTLRKISKYLKLNSREISYLNGDYSKPATKQEMSEAAESIKEYFDRPDIIAYLMDERWRVFYPSLGMRNLLGLKSEVANAEYMTMFQLMLDPKVGIRNLIETEEFKVLLKNQISRFLSEMAFMEGDEYYKESMSYLLNDHIASSIYADLKQGLKMTYHDESTRVVKFNFGGNIVETRYSREPLPINDRFEAIEYKIANPS